MTLFVRHIAVHKDDVILQFIRLGDRYFLERCLTFGSSSSPGIFDDIAELAVLLAIHILMWRRSMICRELDDTIFIGLLEDAKTWYSTYKAVCARLGVRLADEVKDKAFGPRDKGTLLGLDFDLASWTWSMSASKADKILTLLHLVASDRSITQSDLAKLCGKINFYMDIFQGRWERSFFLEKLDCKTKRDPTVVSVSADMVSQARWWIAQINMRLVYPARIPDPRNPQRSTCVTIFPDAAGGRGAPGTGYGAILWTWPRVFVCHFWPESIRGPDSVTGMDFSNKLFMLEAVAILAGIIADTAKLRNRMVRVYTDNSACVAGFKKRHSHELLGWTALKAAKDVADGLNASLAVEKIRRCSCVGATAADSLSKGNLSEALFYMEQAEPNPGYTSRTLLKWLGNPIPTRVLGLAILVELRRAGFLVLIDFEVSEEILALVAYPKE